MSIAALDWQLNTEEGSQVLLLLRSSSVTRDASASKPAVRDKAYMLRMPRRSRIRAQVGRQCIFLGGALGIDESWRCIEAVGSVVVDSIMQ